MCRTGDQRLTPNRVVSGSETIIPCSVCAQSAKTGPNGRPPPLPARVKGTLMRCVGELLLDQPRLFIPLYNYTVICQNTAEVRVMAVIQDLSLALKAKLFRGLADPSRLAILEVLRQGEQTVSELVVETGLSQPNTSAHLACLKGCGLVTSRQEGRNVYYMIADPRLIGVLGTVEAVLADVAARVYACTRQDGLGGIDGNRN